MMDPVATAGVYTGLLKKITSYQDRLSVRYVLEKLFVEDSQGTAVDHITMQEYLSNCTIQLLLINDFIVKRETPIGVYYELSDSKLIREMEAYARVAPNKELFDNEPLMQVTLKTWRKRQNRFERDQRMLQAFMQVITEREAQIDAILYRFVIPVVCILLLVVLVFEVTHMVE
jgi:cytochrome c oxidase subunit IV